MELVRTVSESSYFLQPKINKTDRRNYCSEKPKPLPEACLFVASLSNTRSISQTYKSLYKHFDKFGPIVNIKVSVDKMNRPFAFVQFKKVRDAKIAMQGQTVIDGRIIRIEKAKVDRELLVSIGYAPLAIVQGYLKYFGPIEKLNVQ